MDVIDLINLVDYCKDKVNRITVNIAGIEKLAVIDLYKKIGYILDINPIIKIKDKKEDDGWTLLSSDIFNDYMNDSKIESSGYTEKIIKKYIKN